MQSHKKLKDRIVTAKGVQIWPRRWPIWPRRWPIWPRRWPIWPRRWRQTDRNVTGMSVLRHLGNSRAAASHLHLRDHSRARPERRGLDSHLLEHAHEQIGEGPVIGAVEGDVALMAEASAREEDRQVARGMPGAVAEVAGMEDHRAVQE